MAKNNPADTDSYWLKRKNGFDANLIYGSKKFLVGTGRDKLIAKPTIELLKVVERTTPGVYRRKDGYFKHQKMCPLCNGKDIFYLLERMGISVYYCKNCDFGFQNPRLKEEILEKLYKNDETNWPCHVSKLQILIDKKKYDYGLDLLETFSPPSKEALLDIGCGSGFSLRRAMVKGWRECVGIELSHRYSFPYHYRIKIINDSFDRAFKKLWVKTDAVMMWDVLEHISDPLGFLGQLKDIMKKGSLILIMVPNLKSLASRLIREKSPTFTWQHLNYFTALSLKKILNNSGFKVEHIETVISEIGNINNYMAFEDPYLGSKEKTITLDFLTSEYIHSNLLGSRLLVIARRNR